MDLQGRVRVTGDHCDVCSTPDVRDNLRGRRTAVHKDNVAIFNQGGSHRASTAFLLGMSLGAMSILWPDPHPQAEDCASVDALQEALAL
jgi:hypothetical protein